MITKAWDMDIIVNVISVDINLENLKVRLLRESDAELVPGEL